VINLIPTPRLLRKRVRDRVRRWAVGFSIYVVALAFGCAVMIPPAPRPVANDDASVQTRLTQLTADFDNANTQLAAARVRHAAALSLTAQPDWGNLLSVLGDKLGEEVVLRDVRLVQSKSAAQRQYTLEMRGLARTQASVSTFVASLEELKLFDQVRLLRTGREPFLSDSVITFDLECSLSDAPDKPSAPVASQRVASTGGEQ
jgi:Tfp pilus assembly protein PilN